jgi:hypothetical protein
LHDDSSDNLLTNEVSVEFPVSILPSIHIPSSQTHFHPLHIVQLLENFADIPDLNLKQTGLGVLLDVDVNGEMCVDVSHLVLEALRDTDDQVVDESADCAEGGDVLSSTVVQLDVDDILLRVREVDRQMVEVLGEFAYSSVSPSCSSAFLPAPIVAYLVVLRR